MPALVKAEPVGRYRLRLLYDDGVGGEIDLADLAGRGVFRAWSAPGAFERLRIAAHGAVEWEDGIDLCADALYMRITGKRPEEVLEGWRSHPARA